MSTSVNLAEPAERIAAIRQSLELDGFAVLAPLYTEEEIALIAAAIESAVGARPDLRSGASLFAIRRFFAEVPGAVPPVFTPRLKALLRQLFGSEYFVVKSIYFDKPAGSNWFVARHQDLSIAVDRKAEQPGFGPWTIKGDSFGVQPPLQILEDNFTLRIHLDETGERNGALRVVPGSHRRGIIRAEQGGEAEPERLGAVAKGGVMLMKPLLLHSSRRSEGGAGRRVIHIEFGRSALPQGLQWAEELRVNWAEPG